MVLELLSAFWVALPTSSWNKRQKHPENLPCAFWSHADFGSELSRALPGGKGGP